MKNELNERVNPVSKTAVATLIQLAAAGYERSAEILKRLGFSERDYAWSLGDRDQLDKTCMVACRGIGKQKAQSGEKTLGVLGAGR